MKTVCLLPEDRSMWNVYDNKPRTVEDLKTNIRNVDNDRIANKVARHNNSGIARHLTFPNRH